VWNYRLAMWRLGPQASENSTSTMENWISDG
jgi:hypothetical protein